MGRAESANSTRVADPFEKGHCRSLIALTNFRLVVLYAPVSTEPEEWSVISGLQGCS